MQKDRLSMQTRMLSCSTQLCSIPGGYFRHCLDFLFATMPLSFTIVLITCFHPWWQLRHHPFWSLQMQIGLRRWSDLQSFFRISEWMLLSLSVYCPVSLACERHVGFFILGGWLCSKAFLLGWSCCSLFAFPFNCLSFQPCDLCSKTRETKLQTQGFLRHCQVMSCDVFYSLACCAL